MAYTTIDDPTIYFNTVLYIGDASSPRTISGVGFSPDLVWCKNRTTANDNRLVDQVRGANKEMSSNRTLAEYSDNSDGNLTSFNSDGFVITEGSSNINNWNKDTDSYVAWCWKASGSTASNGSGDITSTVSANTTAGFSIVSYTGDAVYPSTVGHGLGSAPSVVITKQSSAGTYSWNSYHAGLGNTYYIALETTSAADNSVDCWNSTSPTSSVFTINAIAVNTSGVDFIAYCFAEKQGFSKFGTFTGNGNADGPFIYTGFKPAYLLLKQSSASGEDWVVQDNKRDTFINPVDANLYASANNAEVSGYRYCDFNANGFKIRNSLTDYNQSGTTYIYMAFAEAPFVNSNGVPCNAR